jgi:hypothetical protein
MRLFLIIWLFAWMTVPAIADVNDDKIQQCAAGGLQSVSYQINACQSAAKYYGTQKPQAPGDVCHNGYNYATSIMVLGEATSDNDTTAQGRTIMKLIIKKCMDPWRSRAKDLLENGA